MADEKTIWHHPLGGHGTLKPGAFVKLTCLALCKAASTGAWTDQNESDHQAVWKVVSSTHSDYCIEIPGKGRRAWVDFDFVEEVPAPTVGDDFGPPIPTAPAPVSAGPAAGDNSVLVTPENDNG